MKNITSNMLTMVVIFGLIISLCANGACDEVTDTVEEALSFYAKGEYAAAAGNLEYASQLVRQRSGDALITLLPEPLAGWTATEPVSQAISSVMMGGAVFAERSYSKAISSVTVKIVTDSPMIQSIMMMITNPMFATASGGKIEMIMGQKAVVRHSHVNMTGEVNVVVANRYLVTVSGGSVPKNTLIAYAKAVDFKKMASMP